MTRLSSIVFCACLMSSGMISITLAQSDEEEDQSSNGRPDPRDRVTVPVVYELECNEVYTMFDSVETEDYVAFGQSFMAKENGTLDRITVYPDFLNCTAENTTLDATVYFFSGDINDTDFRQSLMETRDFAVLLNDTDNDELIADGIKFSSNAFTCADWSKTNSTLINPPLRFELIEDDEIYGVSEKWLDAGEIYTWVVVYRHLITEDFTAATETGSMNSMCLSNSEDESNTTDLVDGSFVMYASKDDDSWTNYQRITATGEGGSERVEWTVRLEMDEDLTVCNTSEQYRKNYGRKLHFQVWYFDEALKVISQYVEASEYAVWYAITQVTSDLLALSNEEFNREKLKFSQSEIREFYEAVMLDRCVLWVDVWHMFGLCLDLEGKVCKNWKKEEDKSITGYNSDLGTTYYQLETYIRVASKKLVTYPKTDENGEETANNPKYDEDWFKLVHNIIDKKQEEIRALMNEVMPTRDRPRFNAFGSNLEPLSVWRFIAPEIASWVVLGFIVFSVLFAVAGAVHGFGYWHADNVRISGIILFAIYTADFYTDIVFNLNLINYYEEWAYLFWLSVVFVVIPWILNMVSLSRYQNKWCEDETVRERVYQWFVHWQRLLYALAALSGSAFGTVELANSYVFGYDFFCMGLNERHLKKFNNNRLWSGILAENLPQLCIQFWFLYLTDFEIEENTFTLYAIVLSSLSIGAAVLDIYSSKKLFEALINPESGQYNDKSTLSFQVNSPEIHENKARLQISTYKFRNMLAEVLMLESRAVEMHFPVATASGFKIRFSVFSRDKNGDKIEKVIRESIEMADTERCLAAKIQTVWRLGSKPDVTGLKQEAQVDLDSGDAINISGGGSGEGNGNVTEVQMTTAINDRGEV